MQYLGAEVGKLRGLFEADHLDTARLGAETGIGGHHAVNIRPDFYALCSQAGTHDGSREVRAATTDSGRDAVAGCSDEATHDRHLAGFDQRLHLGAQLVVGFVEERYSPSVGGIGNDALPRIHQVRGNPARRKCGIHDSTREPLPE